MDDCDINNENITPVVVRDKIIDCFYEAHGKLIEQRLSVSDESKEEFTKGSIISIFKDQFEKTGGDFDNPTKESLFYAIINLAEFSKNFRDIDMIVNHFISMLNLINKL